MAEAKDGCVKPAKGPIVSEENGSKPTTEKAKEEVRVRARIGQAAPDFEVSAYFDGGFQNVKLSDYLGKWVVLCFYPGDFTFV